MKEAPAFVLCGHYIRDVRDSTFLFALLLAAGALAQGKSCGVPQKLYETISVERIRKHGPEFRGDPFLLDPGYVERAECILDKFIRWHNSLTRAQRDSLMDATNGHVRPECMMKEWSQYYRQYAGERSTDGDIIVHINLMRGDHYTAITQAMRSGEGPSWTIVNDGGDAFFSTAIHLGRDQVTQYQVNGPYPPNGWCQ